ncbi:hypothetical protein GPECTOR_2g1167 [Gonium pectorale]|uniref:Uncharacterized protein n=1 Tax=Gonium pectorale TaxID=33097 RepID=A0A150H0C1_GONPE|nr:hypothetical protein GPECTOR_2g1167 [Gonium pectorale]|eukprot:KXZ55617.1 hypothetical protein GPECTOR_2g1167 [Gonium pectorale]
MESQREADMDRRTDADAGAPSADEAAAQLRSALALFAREPTRFALRRSVAAVLEAMLAACGGGAEAAERALADFNDRVAFREGEALYVLGLQRYACQRVLEGASFKAAAKAGPPAAAGGAGAAGGEGDGQAAGPNGATAAPAAEAPSAAAATGSGADAAFSGVSAAFCSTYVGDTLAAVTAALQAGEAYVRWRNAALAAAGRLGSRLDRLCRVLELSDKEAALLRYVLFGQTSQEELLAALGGDSRIARQASPAPPSFVGMTTQEFLAFMSSDRRHIREGLLPDCFKLRAKVKELKGYGAKRPMAHGLRSPRGARSAVGRGVLQLYSALYLSPVSSHRHP